MEELFESTAWNLAQEHERQTQWNWYMPEQTQQQADHN